MQIKQSPIHPLIPFLILGAATLVVLVPLALFGMPRSRDFYEHLHLARTYYYSILNGNVLPSWPGDVNGGFGDVSVRFYPPGLSLIWAFARIIFGTWFRSAVAVFPILSFFGGVGTY